MLGLWLVHAFGRCHANPRVRVNPLHPCWLLTNGRQWLHHWHPPLSQFSSPSSTKTTDIIVSCGNALLTWRDANTSSTAAQREHTKQSLPPSPQGGSADAHIGAGDLPASKSSINNNISRVKLHICCCLLNQMCQALFQLCGADKVLPRRQNLGHDDAVFPFHDDIESSMFSLLASTWTTLVPKTCSQCWWCLLPWTCSLSAFNWTLEHQQWWCFRFKSRAGPTHPPQPMCALLKVNQHVKICQPCLLAPMSCPLAHLPPPPSWGLQQCKASNESIWGAFPVASSHLHHAARFHNALLP